MPVTYLVGIMSVVLEEKRTGDLLMSEPEEELQPSPGCPGCGREIDPDVSGCTDSTSAPWPALDGNIWCVPCGRQVDADFERAARRQVHRPMPLGLLT